jgi:hypothetical protein
VCYHVFEEIFLKNNNVKKKCFETKQKNLKQKIKKETKEDQVSGQN